MIFLVKNKVISCDTVNESSDTEVAPGSCSNSDN